MNAGPMSADTARASLLRDRVAYARLVDIRERLGPERMASGATRVRATTHALTMVMVSRGAGIEQVIDTLRLASGRKASAICIAFAMGPVRTIQLCASMSCWCDPGFS